VEINAYFADFFVSRARKSSNEFEDREDEERHLIYNWQPNFVGSEDKVDFSMEQVYLFY